MHVLSVSSLKGGVGKTTITLGLASAAHGRRLRTLVVDLDPQCDTSCGLGAIGEFESTVADVLKSPRHSVVLDSIVAASWSKIQSGILDVLVGSPNSMRFDSPKPGNGQLRKLRRALDGLRDSYDLVLIDTPPSLNALTRTAWTASDGVLLVTEPGLFSIVAVQRALSAADEIIDTVNPNLEVVGIQVNRAKPQLPEQEFRLAEIDELFGELVLKPAIEERAVLSQAEGAAKPISSWGGEAAAELSQQFADILQRSIAHVDAARSASAGNAKGGRSGRRSRKSRD